MGSHKNNRQTEEIDTKTVRVPFFSPIREVVVADDAFHCGFRLAWPPLDPKTAKFLVRDIAIFVFDIIANRHSMHRIDFLNDV
jgi:hypothetical protein